MMEYNFRIIMNFGSNVFSFDGTKAFNVSTETRVILSFRMKILYLGQIAYNYIKYFLLQSDCVGKK